jgi:hypothetical protein
MPKKQGRNHRSNHNLSFNIRKKMSTKEVKRFLKSLTISKGRARTGLPESQEKAFSISSLHLLGI